MTSGKSQENIQFIVISLVNLVFSLQLTASQLESAITKFGMGTFYYYPRHHHRINTPSRVQKPQFFISVSLQTYCLSVLNPGPIP